MYYFQTAESTSTAAFSWGPVRHSAITAGRTCRCLAAREKRQKKKADMESVNPDTNDPKRNLTMDKRRIPCSSSVITLARFGRIEGRLDLGAAARDPQKGHLHPDLGCFPLSMNGCNPRQKAKADSLDDPGRVFRGDMFLPSKLDQEEK
jgi:hypothetical protein